MSTPQHLNAEAECISNNFETSFMAVSLEQQIKNCNHYELAGLFRRIIPANQPMLEAGCGSGRWVAWATSQGWESIGVDWSEVLMTQARASIPGATFLAGDMRSMPVKSGSIGSILSLGAVEHASEGPDKALNEYFRVLKHGGVAIITVPFFSPLRRVTARFRKIMRLPIEWMKGDTASRRSRRKALEVTNPAWEVGFLRKGQDWSFFEYHFTPRQICECVDAAGFIIDEAFPDFLDEGILHVFHHRTGSYDHHAGRVRLNWLGRLLHTVIPVAWVGHMYCIVARKPTAE